MYVQRFKLRFPFFPAKHLPDYFLSLHTFINIPARIEEGLMMPLTDRRWLPGRQSQFSSEVVAHGRSDILR